MIIEFYDSYEVMSKEEWLKKIETNKNQVDRIFYNEYPIKKEMITKLAILMIKAKLFEENDEYIYIVGNTMLSIFNKDELSNNICLGDLFNCCNIDIEIDESPIDNDDNLYLYESICVTKYKGIAEYFENIINKIDPLFKFIEQYSIQDCIFNNDVLNEFKNKFEQYNYNRA